jgi:hypothetical protein
MALKHMVTIQVGLFTIGFHPDLVAAIFSQVVQTGNTKSEFAWFAKFTENSACWEQFVAAHMSSHLEDFLVDVVNTITMETEHILAIVTLKQKLDVGAQILRQFLKEAFRFFFS